MFWDEDYIEENIENLKEMIENGTFNKDKCNNFISYSDLEDEFNHTEIGDAQEMFIQKAREYLSKFPKRYAIWSDWCVHITTVELYRDIMLGKVRRDENYIKMRESREIV